MKQSRFLTIFIAVHIIFIFLQIHKHTQIVRLSYKQQEYEQLLVALHEKKEHITQYLAALKSHDSVYSFAETTLGMQPLKIQNIKKIPMLCT